MQRRVGVNVCVRAGEGCMAFTATERASVFSLYTEASAANTACPSSFVSSYEGREGIERSVS